MQNMVALECEHDDDCVEEAEERQRRELRDEFRLEPSSSENRQ